MLHTTTREPSPWATCRAEQDAAQDPDECAMCGDDTWDGSEYLGGILCPECYHIEMSRIEDA